MKHLFTLLAISLSSILYAQSDGAPLHSPILLMGQQQVSLSVGTLNTTDFAFSLFGASGAGDPSPSINIDYDYGLLSELRIGIFAGYYNVDATQTSSINSIVNAIEGTNLEGEIDGIIDQFGLGDLLCETLGVGCPETIIEERINVFYIGAKLMYQRSIIPELDTYVSTYAGYSFNRRKTITEVVLDQVSEELNLNTEVPTFIYYGSIGARYYINHNIGIFGEYGIGNVHLLKLGLSYRM